MGWADAGRNIRLHSARNDCGEVCEQGLAGEERMITILGALVSFWLFNYEHRYRAKFKEKNG
jgi:hypothetical protein